MEQKRAETAREWAERQFRGCQLGDWRRTERVVKIGAAMRAAPEQSIPQQMRSPKDTKAAYRFLSDEAYQYEDLIRPHWEQTRVAASQGGMVLMVQDPTELDYTKYERTIQGLAPIGNNRGQGILMSTVLSIVPSPRQVLGIAYQEPFFRKSHPRHETRTQRAQREKESDVWMHAVHAIGPPPEGATWVHVGDSASDIYAFFTACQQEHGQFLVRAKEDRRILDPQGEIDHLLHFARQLPKLDERLLHLPARHGEPARDVVLKLAVATLTLVPNWLNRHADPIVTWVVRVWEEQPPEGVEPIEWVLLTSVPTETLEQAWERVEWYRCRWLVEEFHQCLKTGCQIEARRLEEASSLLRLLAIIAPLAVELLSMKEEARLHPDLPALQVLPADLVRLVAKLSDRSPQELTTLAFWRLVAQQGGYLARKRDGPPGWKSLWHGWVYIQTLLRGLSLAP
jgi:hypothetical protein